MDRKLPGFRIPLGLNTFLIPRITSMALLLNSISEKAFLGISTPKAGAKCLTQ
jgi:hypothetical protein